MNEVIHSLIDSLRRGQYEDPAEKIGLLAAALLEHQADTALLDSLLRAPQIPLRLAALEVSRQRPDPALTVTLLHLARDSESRVRSKLCEALAAWPPESAEEVLKILTGDADCDIRSEALKATSGRPAFREVQQELLLNDPAWSVRHAAAAALGEQADGEGVAGLLTALAQDDDSDVQQRCAELIERALVQQPERAAAKLPGDIAILSKADGAIKRSGGRLPRLRAWLQERTSEAINPAELARFGTDLTAQALNGTLPRAFRLERAVETLLLHLRKERIRSIALIGKSGVGKSSLVQELVYALARPENGGWRVLRMSPTDFMAGTRYLGEWETKVRDLVDAFRRPRKILLYVPNLADLASVGRWSKSDANVLSALAPYLEDGSLLLLGESTPEEFERGLGGELSLQRLFERVLLEEFSRDETRTVLEAIRENTRAPLSDAVLQELQESSEYFLGHLTRPGNAAMLLRAVVTAHREPGRPVTRRDVLDVLSQSTGVPAGLLDDATPLDLSALQTFFEQRVMGQSEAVAATIDVVTLIKAGLTDPHKPFSVMLFVGPTGVGKTELARALAEYIFGDPGRLLRLDMSEFASPDAYTRLIGTRSEHGLLTDPVRQRPFSVVLLDEIEKSHLNVFDLCLQIFDAGRLTDGRGRVVDFRRTIVVLTSNIGAGLPSTPLGFGRTETAAGGDRDHTFRELTRVFRPEFLNRLDRMVHFDPLSLETAERIARRELDLVVQRSGLARRGLTVNLDPCVISLLVKQGYSPHFGARPLKRTVEKLVLLPLARAIATGRTEARSVVNLSVEGEAVTVQLVQPARPRTVSRPPEALITPAGNRALRLRERFGALMAAAWPAPGRKSELVARMQQPGFYQDSTIRDTTFDELHRLEQFLSRRDRLREALVRLEQQSVRLGREDTAAFQERAAELESELEQLEFITRHPGAEELCDALVQISQVSHHGQPLKAVELLVQTYSGLARRRHFEPSVVAESHDDRTDVAVLQILGLGGIALVAPEAGLHEFNRRCREKNRRTGKEQTREDQALVRVEVFPMRTDPPAKFAQQVGLKASPRSVAGGRLLEEVPWRLTAFHEPSIRSLDLWFPGTKAEALAAASRVFHAQVSQPAPAASAAALIRRYDLGIGSRIKDLRTGRTTTRLEQFFRGQVEMPPPSEPQDS